MGRAFKNKALVSPIWNGKMNGSNFTDLAGTGASASLPIPSNGFTHYTKHDADFGSVPVDLVIDNLGDDVYLNIQDDSTLEVETIANKNDGPSSSLELVENGDFSDGLNGWTARGGGTQVLNGSICTMLTGSESNQMSYNSGLNSGKLGKQYKLLGNYNNFVNTSKLHIRLDNIYDVANIIDIYAGQNPVFTAYRDFDFIGFYGGGASQGADVEGVSVKQVLTTSATYTQETTFYAAFTTNVPLTDADRLYIKENKNSVIEMVKTGTNNPDLSFNAGNVDVLTLGTAAGLLSVVTVSELDTTGLVVDMTDSFQGYFNTQNNILQADRDLILDKPDSMNRLMIDDDLATGLSFTKVDVLSYFSGAGGLRGADKLYDHVSTDEVVIQDYVEATRTNLMNQTVGSSNLFVNQDTAGRELSMVEAGTVATDVSGKNINTGFKPSLNNMSLRSIVSGELEDLDANGVGLGTYSQRVEDRWLVVEDDGL